LSTSLKTSLALLVAAATVLTCTSCGNKTPESAAAKKLGDQPKQTVDKVTNDVTKAMQKETERQDEKKE
jgi:hypothetical protein